MSCRFLAFVLAVALLTTGAALAETELTDKTTGAVYILSDGADGTKKLASKADGEADSFVLQPKCYAESPIYGLGAWQNVDGGWRIMIQGTQVLSFDGAAPLENPECVPQ